MKTPVINTAEKNTVAKSASAKEIKLSKPEQAALDAAKTKPKNDGSHIDAERKKLLETAEQNKDEK
jgi:hypothetical protein